MQDSWLASPDNSPPPREIFTVSRLNREARALLERHTDLGGGLPHGYTAHPKRDPRTGRRH